MGETRKLAAILVSDVVGYSRLAGADEDRILARLRTLRSDLIDPIISVHHGHIVKRTGDGSIVEFRSVVDAAISPRADPWTHLNLIAALALAGHEAEAHDALQNYLASIPNWPKTIAALKVASAPSISGGPCYLEIFDRYFDGLRKAGMPEGETKTN